MEKPKFLQCFLKNRPRSHSWFFMVLILGLSIPIVACDSSPSSTDAGTTDGMDGQAETGGEAESQEPDQEEGIEDQIPPSFQGAKNAVAGDNSVILTWDAASDNQDEAGQIVYDVYIALQSGKENFEVPPLASTAPGELSFAVTGLSKEGPYYFVVRARDSAGNQDSNAAEQIGWALPVRYVNALGNGDGVTPDAPMRSIQDALSNLENTLTSKIYVAAGRYIGPFRLFRGVSLLGGYSEDFQERDYAAFESILQGNDEPDVDVVTAASSTTIQGFTITGAKGEGVGINAWDTTAMIRNNLITRNSRSGIFSGGYSNSSNPQITENTITRNGYPNCLHEEMPLQTDPITITLVAYLYPCGGIYVLGFDNTVVVKIADNQITDNEGVGIGFDLYYTQDQLSILRNRIARNTYSGIHTEIEGEEGRTPTFNLMADILHNQITHNGLHGIELWASEGGFHRGVIRNNLVAFNQEDGLSIESRGYMGVVLTDMGPKEFLLPSESSPTITNNLILANAHHGINIYCHGEYIDPAWGEPARNGSANTNPVITNNSVIGNRLSGVLQTVEYGGLSQPELMNDIVGLNQDDLEGTEATFSDVLDENPPSHESNFCVEPGWAHAATVYDFTNAIGTFSSVPVSHPDWFSSVEFVEIGADGIARKIESLDLEKGDIGFSPALRSLPAANISILGWPSDDLSKDFHLKSDSPLVDRGNPGEAYQDVIPPGQGTVTNDPGAYGGPYADSIP